MGTDVLHHTVQLQFAHVLLPLVLHVDVLSADFHLHGQTLASLPYGCQRVQSLDLRLCRQAFQPVGNDVDGVFCLILLEPMAFCLLKSDAWG